MATAIRFEWNHEEFQRILNSSQIRDRINAMGRAVASAAGEGFDVEEYTANYGGSPRPMAVVRAATYEARLAEARDKALTRALGAASGAR